MGERKTLLSLGDERQRTKKYRVSYCERAFLEGDQESEELWCRFILNKSASYTVREEQEEQQPNAWAEQRRAVTPGRKMAHSVDVDSL